MKQEIKQTPGGMKRDEIDRLAACIGWEYGGVDPDLPVPSHLWFKGDECVARDWNPYRNSQDLMPVMKHINAMSREACMQFLRMVSDVTFMSIFDLVALNPAIAAGVCLKFLEPDHT